jgi:hypothetical protein
VNTTATTINVLLSLNCPKCRARSFLLPQVHFDLIVPHPLPTEKMYRKNSCILDCITFDLIIKFYAALHIFKEPKTLFTARKEKKFSSIFSVINTKDFCFCRRMFILINIIFTLNSK